MLFSFLLLILGFYANSFEFSFDSFLIKPFIGFLDKGGFCYFCRSVVVVFIFYALVFSPLISILVYKKKLGYAYAASFFYLGVVLGGILPGIVM